jgi:hypothetical protein
MSRRYRLPVPWQRTTAGSYHHRCSNDRGETREFRPVLDGLRHMSQVIQVRPTALTSWRPKATPKAKTTTATTSWGSHVSRGILVTCASVRPGLMTPWTARNPGLLPLGDIKSRAPLTGRRASPNDTTITLHFSTLPHTLPIVSTPLIGHQSVRFRLREQARTHGQHSAAAHVPGGRNGRRGEAASQELHGRGGGSSSSRAEACGRSGSQAATGRRAGAGVDTSGASSTRRGGSTGGRRRSGHGPDGEARVEEEGRGGAGGEAERAGSEGAQGEDGGAEGRVPCRGRRRWCQPGVVEAQSRADTGELVAFVPVPLV